MEEENKAKKKKINIKNYFIFTKNHRSTKIKQVKIQNLNKYTNIDICQNGVVQKISKNESNLFKEKIKNSSRLFSLNMEQNNASSLTISFSCLKKTLDFVSITIEELIKHIALDKIKKIQSGCVPRKISKNKKTKTVFKIKPEFEKLLKFINIYHIIASSGKTINITMQSLKKVLEMNGLHWFKVLSYLSVYQTHITYEDKMDMVNKYKVITIRHEMMRRIAQKENGEGIRFVFDYNHTERIKTSSMNSIGESLSSINPGLRNFEKNISSSKASSKNIKKQKLRKVFKIEAKFERLLEFIKYYIIIFKASRNLHRISKFSYKRIANLLGIHWYETLHYTRTNIILANKLGISWGKNSENQNGKKIIRKRSISTLFLKHNGTSRVDKGTMSGILCGLDNLDNFLKSQENKQDFYKFCLEKSCRTVYNTPKNIRLSIKSNVSCQLFDYLDELEDESRNKWFVNKYIPRGTCNTDCFDLKDMITKNLTTSSNYIDEKEISNEDNLLIRQISNKKTVNTCKNDKFEDINEETREENSNIDNEHSNGNAMKLSSSAIPFIVKKEFIEVFDVKGKKYLVNKLLLKENKFSKIPTIEESTIEIDPNRLVDFFNSENEWILTEDCEGKDLILNKLEMKNLINIENKSIPPVTVEVIDYYGLIKFVKYERILDMFFEWSGKFDSGEKNFINKIQQEVSTKCPKSPSEYNFDNDEHLIEICDINGQKHLLSHSLLLSLKKTLKTSGHNEIIEVDRDDSKMIKFSSSVLIDIKDDDKWIQTEDSIGNKILVNSSYAINLLKEQKINHQEDLEIEDYIGVRRQVKPRSIISSLKGQISKLFCKAQNEIYFEISSENNEEKVLINQSQIVAIKNVYSGYKIPDEIINLITSDEKLLKTMFKAIDSINTDDESLGYIYIDDIKGEKFFGSLEKLRNILRDNSYVGNSYSANYPVEDFYLNKRFVDLGKVYDRFNLLRKNIICAVDKEEEAKINFYNEENLCKVKCSSLHYPDHIYNEGPLYRYEVVYVQIVDLNLNNFLISKNSLYDFLNSSEEILEILDSEGFKRITNKEIIFNNEEENNIYYELVDNSGAKCFICLNKINHITISDITQCNDKIFYLNLKDREKRLRKFKLCSDFNFEKLYDEKNNLCFVKACGNKKEANFLNIFEEVEDDKYREMYVQKIELISMKNLNKKKSNFNNGDLWYDVLNEKGEKVTVRRKIIFESIWLSSQNEYKEYLIQNENDWGIRKILQKTLNKTSNADNNESIMYFGGEREFISKNRKFPFLNNFIKLKDIDNKERYVSLDQLLNPNIINKSKNETYYELYDHDNNKLFMSEINICKENENRTLLISSATKEDQSSTSINRNLYSELESLLKIENIKEKFYLWEEFINKRGEFYKKILVKISSNGTYVSSEVSHSKIASSDYLKIIKRQICISKEEDKLVLELSKQDPIEAVLLEEYKAEYILTYKLIRSLARFDSSNDLLTEDEIYKEKYSEIKVNDINTNQFENQIAYNNFSSISIDDSITNIEEANKIKENGFKSLSRELKESFVKENKSSICEKIHGTLESKSEQYTRDDKPEKINETITYKFLLGSELIDLKLSKDLQLPYFDIDYTGVNTNMSKFKNRINKKEETRTNYNFNNYLSISNLKKINKDILTNKNQSSDRTKEKITYNKLLLFK